MRLYALGMNAPEIDKPETDELRKNCVAVFCAAAEGARPEYREVATELGRALAARGIGLIYGGAALGLMGAVADASLEAGGRVVGVIPQVLVDMEVAHEGLRELHVVDTMHTRKRLMGELADAFIVLPGGFGTFEELFEVLAWQTLKLHAKPIVLLNIEGFYDTLLVFLDLCEREGMLRGNRNALLVANTVEDALALACPKL
ncbi:MAG: TIGR00730 family Rossman fold protein [Janthinobacterium lividum]